MGGGPFPTELLDETGEELRKAGQEFGAVTGRPRRCGWLDLVAVNYTIMLNGVTKLIITKADVLNIFDEVKVCNEYSITDSIMAAVPFDITSASIVPVYETLPGWKTDHSMKTSAELPASLHSFMNYIRHKTGVDISIISIGAGRDQLVAF